MSPVVRTEAMHRHHLGHASAARPKSAMRSRENIESANRRLEEENLRLKTITNDEEDRIKRMTTKVYSVSIPIRQCTHHRILSLFQKGMRF